MNDGDGCEEAGRSRVVDHFNRLVGDNRRDKKLAKGRAIKREVRVFRVPWLVSALRRKLQECVPRHKLR